MAFDLDALAAETEPSEPFPFTFGGEEYTLPGEPDLVSAEMISNRNLLGGFVHLAGEDQWTRIKDSKSLMTSKMLVALFEEYTKHLGLGPGESEGSTSS